MMRTLVPTRDMHFRQFSTEKREGKVANSGLQLWEMAITKPALLAAIVAIAAEAIGKQAKAILVFPNVVKGGFLVAAHHGDGALRVTSSSHADNSRPKLSQVSLSW